LSENLLWRLCMSLTSDHCDSDWKMGSEEFHESYYQLFQGDDEYIEIENVYDFHVTLNTWLRKYSPLKK